MSLIARFVNVGDILAANIQGFLGTRQAGQPNGTAVRTWGLSITDTETAGQVADGNNFRVFVHPDVPKWEILTKGKDLFTYPFNVLFFEKYVGQTTPPPNTWVDSRVFLVDQIMREFGDLRKPLTGNFDGLRCTGSEYTDFVDQDMLREEGVFWTEIDLTYQEAARV